MPTIKDIQTQKNQISDIANLINAFGTIASIRVKQIRTKVLSSQEFFDELWSLYTQLRKDPEESFKKEGKKINKNAVVAISSTGKLSGELDLQLVNIIKKEVNLKESDIIAIGLHGASLLRQKNISPVKTFEMPEVEKNIEKIYLTDVTNLIELIQRYKNTIVYYQSYKSLAVQKIKKIELAGRVRQLQRAESASKHSGEIIHKKEYIFEPSFDSVIKYMESIMLKIALNQILLESRLAQHASRFNAMNRAGRQAKEVAEGLDKQHHRAQREKIDKELKEIVSSSLAHESRSEN